MSDHIKDMIGSEKISNILRAAATILGLQSCTIEILCKDLGRSGQKGSPLSQVLREWFSNQEHPAVLCTEDISVDKKLAELPEAKAGLVGALLAAPLVTANGRTVAAVVATTEKARTFLQWQVQLMANLAQLAVQCVERPQLLKTTAEERQELISAIVGSTKIDFAAGPFRLARMADALREGVCLVWASPGSMDWPILYCNEVWENYARIKFQNPCSNAAEGGPTLKESYASLWDHLHLPELSVGMIKDIWQKSSKPFCSKPLVSSEVPASELCARGCFSVQAELSRALPSPFAGSRVLCRFSPVEQPLDVSAGAIKVPVVTDPRSCPTPDIKLDVRGIQSGGHLYFVTVVVPQQVQFSEVHEVKSCRPRGRPRSGSCPAGARTSRHRTSELQPPKRPQDSR